MVWFLYGIKMAWKAGPFYLFWTIWKVSNSLTIIMGVYGTKYEVFFYVSWGWSKVYRNNGPNILVNSINFLGTRWNVVFIIPLYCTFLFQFASLNNCMQQINVTDVIIQAWSTYISGVQVKFLFSINLLSFEVECFALWSWSQLTWSNDELTFQRVKQLNKFIGQTTRMFSLYNHESD